MSTIYYVGDVIWFVKAKLIYLTRTMFIIVILYKYMALRKIDFVYKLKV
jgi:hypothetical protein